MKIKIEDMSYMGYGVGRADGKVVFVPYSDVDEVVDVQILENRKSFSIARLESVETPSKDRCKPFCKFYGECNGCIFQHVNYERELEIKKKILKSELSKVGFYEDIEIISKDRYFYRNKLKLTYQNGQLGYKTKTEFLEIDSCPLASKKILEAILDVQEHLKMYKYIHLQNITFRETDDKVLIVFLFDQAEELKFDSDKYIVTTALGEILENSKTKVLDEKEAYKTVVDIKAPIYAKSFFQINDKIAESLYKKVLSYVKGSVVINAYSGQGVLTNLLAKTCQKVVGIEVEKSSHKIAEQIKLSNVTNICGLVEEEILEVVKKYNAKSIVLDPARDGCEKAVLNAITKSEIEEVVYVSCNFATLTRDLKILTQKYKIKEITAFDMFPNTANIETLVYLTK